MDSEEETDFAQITELNYKKIEAKLQKIGYADGVTAGNENAFQCGFDRGYEDGFRTAFELAKFAAFHENTRLERNDDLKKDNEEFLKMNIPKADSGQHFQYLKHKDAHIEEISKQQQKYVDEMVHQFQQRIPHTANLLKTD